MGYHDDGETGLGPIVSSLSLGSDAWMSFSRKEGRSRGKDGKKGHKTCLFKVLLRHGDVVIMEVSEYSKYERLMLMIVTSKGSGCQSQFEHSVETLGPRFGESF